MTAGFAAEIDVRVTADGAAMAFHDAALERLLGRPGRFEAWTADALAGAPLRGAADGAGPPRFQEILELVGGRVPLLVELKDPADGLGPSDGRLAAALAAGAEGYPGPLAFMSFSPHLAAACRRAMPGRPVGLTVGRAPASPPDVAALAGPDIAAAAFVSLDAALADGAAAAAFRASGRPLYCWTVRDAATAARLEPRVDGITFEGFAPQTEADP